MFNKKVKHRFLIILLVIIGLGELQAQVRVSSPYSRFGIGDLRGGKNDVAIFSMGGIRNAVNKPWIVNHANPATYATFDSISFVFEGGILSRYTQLRTSELSQSSFYASLDHILLGFPVTQWWKSSLGIMPLSDIGYDITEERFSEEIGNTTTRYEGSGGINQFYWGNAFIIRKGLSVGVNAFYNFGSIDKSRVLYFPDSLQTMLNTRLENRLKVSDISFSFGVLYVHEFEKGLRLSSGGSFAFKSNLNSRREYLVNTFQGGIDQQEFFLDTVLYTPEEKGSITYPSRFGVGMVIEKPYHWLAGVDFNWQNWSDYRAFGYSDSLQNSWDVAIGGQYIPDHDANRGYLKRVAYRFGARYSNSYLNIFDTQINEFGISFGFGLPLRRSLTSLNFGFELGRRGTIENDLIQENFVKFTFSISVYENWFIRTRYK